MPRPLNSISIFEFDESTFAQELQNRYGKGLFHSRGTMTHLYSQGALTGLEHSPAFRDNPGLAQKIVSDFSSELPAVASRLEENGAIKFTLQLPDQHCIEAVIVPMKNHTTLCVSSQVGCARGCVFCRTGQMGIIRDLSAGEIVAQYMVARFGFKQNIQNIVFMGMGEPLDNLDAVLTAITILSNSHGAAVLPRRISISTCGQGQGLLHLKNRIATEKAKNYHLIPLCISLHALNNQVRDYLMPINRLWPLETLRSILLDMPHAQDKDKIFFEYLVIPTVNDSAHDAKALAEFMIGFKAKVNLIAFQAPSGSTLPQASWSDVDRFWTYLRTLGVACYSRVSKGGGISASCGQLATDAAADLHT